MNTRHDDVAWLSAHELSACYRERTLSPVEVCEILFSRIDQLNVHVNAFFAEDRDGALVAARASENRWRAAQPSSPLDGVPISVKDHIFTRDMPSLFGVRGVDANGPWRKDSAPVARLREAGAIIFAKTTMSEMGALPSGASLLYGTSRNPWRLTLTAGGSSGGAGAAVSAGLGPLAIGSDGGGSLRIPAAYTGIFGFKPSGGRVPMTPTLGTNPVIGGLARSVRDMALLMETLSRPDERDYYADPRPAFVSSHIDVDLEGVRIGYIPYMGFADPVEPETAAAVRAAVQALAAAGARVSEVPPVFDYHLHDETFPATLPGFVRRFEKITRQTSLLLPELQELARRCESLSLAEHLTACTRLGESVQRFMRVLLDYDLLVTPTMTALPFIADCVQPPAARLDKLGYAFDHCAFLLPANQCALPACSINCGYTASGLPIGMQIVGQRYGDADVLRLARMFESMQGTPRRPPLPAAQRASPA